MVPPNWYTRVQTYNWKNRNNMIGDTTATAASLLDASVFDVFVAGGVEMMFQAFRRLRVSVKTTKLRT